MQFLPRGHADHVRHVGGVEGGGDLRVQVDAVHHDDDRGIAELRDASAASARQRPSERLAAALKMPDEALFRLALDHALDDLVRREILLVAADDLDAPVLLVRGEEGEVLQDVEHHFGPEHALHRRLHVVQLAFLLVLLVAPRAPHLDGHADGAVAEQACPRWRRKRRSARTWPAPASRKSH